MTDIQSTSEGSSPGGAGGAKESPLSSARAAAWGAAEASCLAAAELCSRARRHAEARSVLLERARASRDPPARKVALADADREAQAERIDAMGAAKAAMLAAGIALHSHEAANPEITFEVRGTP